MKTMRTINSSELLKKQMENAEFRKEFDAFEKEFKLAQEVILLRKKAHLTQVELARRAGTSQPAIARLESGEYRNISLSFIRKIGRALNAVPEIHLKHL